MTTHLPHWSKLSFHKKPTKLVATDASPPPPMMQTPLVASSAAAAAGSRRPPSTVFTDDSSSGSPRSEEEKGAAAAAAVAVGGDGDSDGEEEENGGEIESKEEDLLGLVACMYISQHCRVLYITVGAKGGVWVLERGVHDGGGVLHVEWEGCTLEKGRGGGYPGEGG